MVGEVPQTTTCEIVTCVADKIKVWDKIKTVISTGVHTVQDVEYEPKHSSTGRGRNTNHFKVIKL